MKKIGLVCMLVTSFYAYSTQARVCLLGDPTCNSGISVETAQKCDDYVSKNPQWVKENNLCEAMDYSLACEDYKDRYYIEASCASGYVNVDTLTEGYICKDTKCNGKCCLQEEIKCADEYKECNAPTEGAGDKCVESNENFYNKDPNKYTECICNTKTFKYTDSNCVGVGMQLEGEKCSGDNGMWWKECNSRFTSCKDWNASSYSQIPTGYTCDTATEIQLRGGSVVNCYTNCRVNCSYYGKYNNQRDCIGAMDHSVCGADKDGCWSFADCETGYKYENGACVPNCVYKDVTECQNQNPYAICSLDSYNCYVPTGCKTTNGYVSGSVDSSWFETTDVGSVNGVTCLKITGCKWDNTFEEYFTTSEKTISGINCDYPKDCNNSNGWYKTCDSTSLESKTQGDITCYKCTNCDYANQKVCEDANTGRACEKDDLGCYVPRGCKNGLYYIDGECVRGCVIGDLYYTDKTCGDVNNYDGTKIPVGIVTYVNETGDGGIIISLHDVGPNDYTFDNSLGSQYFIDTGNMLNNDLPYSRFGSFWGLYGANIPNLPEYNTKEMYDLILANDQNAFTGKLDTFKPYRVTPVETKCLDGTYKTDLTPIENYCRSFHSEIYARFYPHPSVKNDPELGIGKWYIPSAGEWIRICSNDPSSIEYDEKGTFGPEIETWKYENFKTVAKTISTLKNDENKTKYIENAGLVVGEFYQSTYALANESTDTSAFVAFASRCAIFTSAKKSTYVHYRPIADFGTYKTEGAYLNICSTRTKEVCSKYYFNSVCSADGYKTCYGPHVCMTNYYMVPSDCGAPGYILTNTDPAGCGTCTCAVTQEECPYSDYDEGDYGTLKDRCCDGVSYKTCTVKWPSSISKPTNGSLVYKTYTACGQTKSIATDFECYKGYKKSGNSCIDECKDYTLSSCTTGANCSSCSNGKYKITSCKSGYTKRTDSSGNITICEKASSSSSSSSSSGGTNCCASGWAYDCGNSCSSTQKYSGNAQLCTACGSSSSSSSSSSSGGRYSSSSSSSSGLGSSSSSSSSSSSGGRYGSSSSSSSGFGSSSSSSSSGLGSSSSSGGRRW